MIHLLKILQKFLFGRDPTRGHSNHHGAPQNGADFSDHERNDGVTVAKVSSKDVLTFYTKSTETDVLVADQAPFGLNDDSFFEQARIQWQFGEWDNLAKLSLFSIEQQPQRSRLALMVAASHMQLGNLSAADKLVRKAMSWGADRSLVSRVMISSVHNTLAKAALASNRQDLATRLIKDSIKTAMPAASSELLVNTRMQHQAALVEEKLQRRRSNQRQIHGQSAVLLDVIPRHIQAEANNCFMQEDCRAAVRELMTQRFRRKDEQFMLYLALAQLFRGKKDNLTAIDFLSRAKPLVANAGSKLKVELIRAYIALGQKSEASSVYLSGASDSAEQLELHPSEIQAMANAVEELKASQHKKQAHGQLLLLDYLKRHSRDLMRSVDRPLRLLEIGTTREDVPGQGSTKQFMHFCRDNSLDFVSVDMDSENTARADELFKKEGVNFRAIAAKGEEFLENTAEEFDFVFLDAYDFDHGGHSDLRQSRYEAVLGDRINDQACHEMHLRCVVALVKKLPAHGLICFDDTWLEDGKWMAKGTTAMPYLLSHNFVLLDVRNRAALLSRGS